MKINRSSKQSLSFLEHRGVWLPSRRVAEAGNRNVSAVFLSGSTVGVNNLEGKSRPDDELRSFQNHPHPTRRSVLCCEFGIIRLSFHSFVDSFVPSNASSFPLLCHKRCQALGSPKQQLDLTVACSPKSSLCLPGGGMAGPGKSHRNGSWHWPFPWPC